MPVVEDSQMALAAAKNASRSANRLPLIMGICLSATILLQAWLVWIEMHGLAPRDRIMVRLSLLSLLSLLAVLLNHARNARHRAVLVTYLVVLNFAASMRDLSHGAGTLELLRICLAVAVIVLLTETALWLLREKAAHDSPVESPGRFAESGIGRYT